MTPTQNLPAIVREYLRYTHKALCAKTEQEVAAARGITMALIGAMTEEQAEMAIAIILRAASAKEAK